MSRPATPKAERLRLALEARRAVDKELAAVPVPSQTVAVERAAERLGVTARTMWSRLADVPADPLAEVAGAFKVARSLRQQLHRDWTPAQIRDVISRYGTRPPGQHSGG